MTTDKVFICNRHFAAHMVGENQVLCCYAVPKKNFDRLSSQATSSVVVSSLGPSCSAPTPEYELPAARSTVSEQTSDIFRSAPVLPAPRAAPIVQQTGGRSQVKQMAHMATQTCAKDSVASLEASRQSQAKEIKRLNEALKRMRLKMEQLKSQAECPISIQQFRTACDAHLESPISDFVKAQTSQTAHYSRAMKELSLRLLLKSNRFYEEMRNVFRMPSRATLMNEIADVPCDTGLNELVLQAMKEHIQLCTDPLQKYCTITMDEMSIKRHLQLNTKTDRIIGFSDFEEKSEDKNIANSCLTIMSQGIFSNWKQPIAFYFVSAPCDTKKTAELIQAAVQALTDAGYIVVAMISDQGVNFYGACRLLIKSAEEPFFMVGDTKVYYLYDVPHLLKNMRNCLLNNTVTVGNVEVAWRHIVDFYNADLKCAPERNAPKLSILHICPKDRQKMKVRLAAEVLSQTVATNMQAFVNQGHLKEEALATAEFIAKVDKLFDLFNADSKDNRWKPYRRGYCGEAYQDELLDDMFKLIGTISVFGEDGANNTNKHRHLLGWKQNIMAIKQIWHHLRNVDGVTFLPTKNMNQDPLENFFGLMRNAGGDNRTPTCYQFMNYFRRATCINIMSLSDGTNCKNDLGYLLITGLYKKTASGSGNIKSDTTFYI